MVVVKTSASAANALRALSLLSSDSDRLQLKIATGKRIAKAEDNAAYWSISTTMRSNMDSLGAIKDSLGIAIGIVDTALSVADPIMKNLDGYINDFVLGRVDVPVAGKANTPLIRKLDTDMQQRAAAIGNMIVSASFNGVNLLYRPNGKPTSLAFPIGADTTSGKFQTINMTLDLTKTTLIDGDPAQATNFGALSRWLTDPWGWTSGRSFFSKTGWGPTGWPPTFYPTTGSTNQSYQQGAVDVHMWMVNNLRVATQDVFAYLGTVKQQLEGQLKQVTTQATILQKGIGGLVDADLDDASVRLKALEVQKSLAAQVVSLANQKGMRTLELFRV